MKAKQVGAIGIFAVASIVATYAAIHTWNGVIYVSNSRFNDGHRNPAAISKVFDFSQLNGSALRVRSQRRLVEDAKIINQKDSIGIELGHFVTRGEDNAKVFACDYYDHVILTFKADGIAENGERPEMIVEAPCLMSADINRMAPIFIPVAKILNEKPSNQELDYKDSSGVNYKFNAMTGQWPREWSLQEVKLQNQQHIGQEILVSADELHQILEHPLTLQW